MLKPKLVALAAMAAVMASAGHVACASVPQLVRSAIEHGHASGNIQGPIAEETRRRLNATGALSLEVTRIYLFEQPDCARVQLDFQQEAALLPGSALPTPYAWSTQLNICSDGYPPAALTRRKK